ncbi:U3 small nucleolar RNA-associated protein 25 homolog [Dreissena polymorpha]|nr:U3 small nucleolar RNA-associated protein 25 homolog [Dreissena polymorpha]
MPNVKRKPQQKNQGNKRKRRQIDLGALSKKHRKLYREEGKRPMKKETENIVAEETDVKANENNVNSEEDSYSSSDEEHNPYQQLLSQLVPSRLDNKSHVDSDESESSESNEELEDDEDVEEIEADTKDLDSEVESEAEDDSEHANDDGDDDDSDNREEDGEEEVEDDEVDDVDDDTDNILLDTDPFLHHFERVLDEDVAEKLTSCSACQSEDVKVPGVGVAQHKWPSPALKVKHSYKDDKRLKELHVKEALCGTLAETNRKLCNVSTDGLTPFQSGLFQIFNNYQDVFYSERDKDKGEQLRLAYCLHALNHVLKTRKQVVAHNTKIKQKGHQDVDDDFRDQGLTRPKVLMIVPFRDSAKKIVDILIELLNPTDQTMQSFVSNKKRFYQEYTLPEEDEPKKGYKPEDFEATFEGNIDDHFRIGLGVAKKTLKLYTQFYMSDIILASPLGLRRLIGAEGEKERDYDFLSSIEMLIIDQADVLMMQNWDHVLHIMRHLHLQPQESHGVDFSRVRMWTLNGWSKFYRQTLLFSAVSVPEMSALFNKHCHNYAGKYQFLRKPSTGTICQIAAQLPQVFHRIESSSYTNLPDDRFEFFIKKVFPQHSKAGIQQTLIFIPSYFDFVRLRNYFKREGINVLQVSEYTEDKAVNTARNLFFHHKVPYMLYTERFHFYKRVRVRGIRHLIFYSLPQYPHLYSEVCNMMQDSKVKAGADYSCTVLYSKFDAQRLAEIVGTERAGVMLTSQKSVHMFVSGENG